MGRYARDILPSLQRRHEMHVWCPRSAGSTIPFSPVIPFETIEALGDSRLNDYDLIVYQLGNDARNFDRILPLALKVPGVHILHDYVMHNLIAQITLEKAKDPFRYIWLMQNAYGEAGRKLAEDAVTGRNHGVWQTSDVERYPLFEPVLANSLGVVVHSNFFLRAVRRSFHGPSTKIDLAVAPIPAFRKATREELGVEAGKVLLVSTGYINRPKLLDHVIEALHRNPELAAKALFVIAGADCPVESPRLRAMVEAYGLRQSVRLTGFLPEETMHSWIANADVCINLRRPNTEGASYSVIEQMRHGKTVAVIRTGFYAELPEGTVVEIEPEGLLDLDQTLLRLVSDREFRDRTGAAACDWATAGFQPDCYGTALADFLEEAYAAKPAASQAQTARSDLAGCGSEAGELTRASTDREPGTLFG